MEKIYIDFQVAPYALPSVILALSHNGVHTFAVTKEDNNLHIRIDDEVLMEAVYCIKNKSEPMDCVPTSNNNKGE
jgi:hypothetical protein